MDPDQDIQVINPKDKNASPEESRTATSSQRPEPFPTGNSVNIPVLVQQHVCSGKAAEVGASAKPLDRDNELLSSSKDVLGTRKYRGPSTGLDTYVLQRKSPKDKFLVEKPKHFVRGPEERVVTKEGKYLSGSSSSLQKRESSSTSAKQGKASQKGNQKAKGKGKSNSNNPYPWSYRISKKEKQDMENVLIMERTFMEFKNNEDKRMNKSLSKKYTL
ncbi:hypothetical protein O181_075610 [Austropuccinia psidii MF-1]|uniref:Uncharacterized protein n=1 Tax=Austropuccinia psidii MF-1 TaxID=1389203 RepID=A0A9Q3FEP8_9BASI|nr:hypothetical protein [Austropuccinia psidii MF-1]